MINPPCSINVIWNINTFYSLGGFFFKKNILKTWLCLENESLIRLWIGCTETLILPHIHE